MIDYRLYLVTDDPSRYSGNWIDNVVAAVEGGVTCVQYRDTESPRRVRYERILKLMDAIPNAFVVVNNDAELAAAVDADGVHVGQSDMSVAEARRIVGKGKDIGLSITDISQLSAVADDADVPDVFGIGPVFDARKTKADASAAMGVSGCAAIKAALDCHPALVANPSRFGTIAIGGINLENAADVCATGVFGLAVVSAFSKSEDPYGVARAFRRIIGW